VKNIGEVFMLFGLAVAAAEEKHDAMQRVLFERFAGRAVAVFSQLAQVGGALQQNGRGPVIQMILVERGFGGRPGNYFLLCRK
jgi:hypothetical protein